MIDNQLGRRNIPDYARGELNWKKLEILKPQADANVQGRGKVIPKSEKLSITHKVAEASKLGHDTASKIKFIRDNADEETKAKLRSGNKELSIR